MAEFTVDKDSMNDRTIIHILLDNYVTRELLIEEIIRQAAKELAAKATEEMLPEIIERINPDAIANMAIASAGAKINETLNKKLPDVVQHHHHDNKTIYKRGLFGGFKKII